MKCVKIYISDDGIQFASEEACVAYEKKIPEVKLINFIAHELLSNPDKFNNMHSLSLWLYKNKDIILEYYKTKEDGIFTILSKYFTVDEEPNFGINAIFNIIYNEQNYLQHCFFKD